MNAPKNCIIELRKLFIWENESGYAKVQEGPMNGEQSVRIIYILKTSAINAIQTTWKRESDRLFLVVSFRGAENILLYILSCTEFTIVSLCRGISCWYSRKILSCFSTVNYLTE